MKGFGSLIGLLAALALLALGVLLLPEPGISSTAALFTALWLFIALVAAISFGREALRRERLNRIRKRLQRTAGSGYMGPARSGINADSREVFIRQRERRTD